jgi:hypothetical protein
MFQIKVMDEKFEVLTAIKIQVVDLWIVILKMEAARSSEKLVSYHITTWRYDPRRPQLEKVNKS